MDTHAVQNHPAAEAELVEKQAQSGMRYRLVLGLVAAVSCGTGAVIAVPSLLNLLLAGAPRLLSALEGPVAEVAVGVGGAALGYITSRRR